jgi:hypothetical protein
VSLGFAAIAVRQLRLALMFQGDQQKKENRPVERQRLEKNMKNNDTTVKSPGGSRHSRLGIKKQQPVGDQTRQRAEGPSNFWAMPTVGQAVCVATPNSTTVFWFNIPLL